MTVTITMCLPSVLLVTNGMRPYILTLESTPMKKTGSGMISFSSDKEDYLLTIGGFGPTPATALPHSVYTPHPTLPNRMYTNEAHVLCVSSSPGITVFFITLLT